MPGHRSQGRNLGDVPVPAGFADAADGKRNAMFRAVFRELANPRAGTASTLRRDEVRGGGKKPWKQKGTGRARQGSTRSPQWRHGGVVFGPKPRSFEVSLNKKERRAAMRAALSDRFACDLVTILSTDGLRDRQDRRVRRVAVLVGEGRQDRAAHAGRLRRQRARRRSATRLSASGATCNGSPSPTPARSTSRTCSATAGSS